jgi:hypothetical protein
MFTACRIPESASICGQSEHVPHSEVLIVIELARDLSHDPTSRAYPAAALGTAAR